MIALSLPLALAPTDLSGKTLSSPPHRVRSRLVVASATATATKDSSTRTEKPRPSYLNPPGVALCASLYEILGIPAGASNQEIKAAYRRLARECHPDVAAIDRKNSSGDEFMRIHAAYSTLSDPEKRADYDRSLLRRTRPLTMSSIFPGYTCRSWETDQCW